MKEENRKLRPDVRPKLLAALRTYSKEKFAGDLMAGIIVGIVALPLAIAFGIANKFDECMKLVPGGDKPTIRIIRMRKVPFMDSTGLHNLESLCRLSRREGITVVLSGVNDNVRAMLIRSGMDARLGADNICSNIQEALARARALLE